jgi:hypothetical protein
MDIIRTTLALLLFAFALGAIVAALRFVAGPVIVLACVVVAASWPAPLNILMFRLFAPPSALFLLVVIGHFYLRWG